MLTIEQLKHIKRTEDILIRGHGFVLDRKRNNRTMILANEIAPFLQDFNFDSTQRTDCDGEKVKELMEQIADTLKIPEEAQKIPILVGGSMEAVKGVMKELIEALKRPEDDREIPILSPDTTDGKLPYKTSTIRGDNCLPLFIHCEELIHLDMVPEFFYQLLTANQYFRFKTNRGFNYYDSETFPYAAKHISSKEVDSLVGNDSTSLYSLGESLDRLKRSIALLNGTKNADFDRTGILQAVRDYEFKFFSSAIHGILTLDAYESNPGKVKYHFTDMFYNPNMRSSSFFEKIGVNIYGDNVPAVVKQKVAQASRK